MTNIFHIPSVSRCVIFIFQRWRPASFRWMREMTLNRWNVRQHVELFNTVTLSTFKKLFLFFTCLIMIKQRTRLMIFTHRYIYHYICTTVQNPTPGWNVESNNSTKLIVTFSLTCQSLVILKSVIRMHQMYDGVLLVQKFGNLKDGNDTLALMILQLVR